LLALPSPHPFYSSTPSTPFLYFLYFLYSLYSLYSLYPLYSIFVAREPQLLQQQRRTKGHASSRNKLRGEEAACPGG
jgi:hypothetical protein